MKKHILLTFYHLGLGGIQTKIIDMANYLADRKDLQVTVLLKRKEPFDRADELDDRVSVVYCPEILPGIIGRRYYYFLILYILFFQPYSVFLSMDRPAVILLKALKYLPWISSKLIVNVDTYLPEHQQSTDDNISRYFPDADTVIAVSQDTYDDLNQRLKVPDPPLRLLHNWTHVDDQTELPTVKKNFHVLYAGRFAAQKQPDKLAEIFEKIHEHTKDAGFEVYGAGELLPDFKKQISGSSVSTSVTFHTPTQEIAQVLKKSKYLVLSSKYEGLPFILLEAMRYGCVILCLDAPGTRDVVTSKTGVIAKTVDELVEGYKKLESDAKLYARVRKAAFQRVKTQFSMDNCRDLSEMLL